LPPRRRPRPRRPPRRPRRRPRHRRRRPRHRRRRARAAAVAARAAAAVAARVSAVAAARAAPYAPWLERRREEAVELLAVHLAQQRHRQLAQCVAHRDRPQLAVGLAQRHQLGRAEQRARLARRLAVEQRLHHQLERPRVAVVVEVLDLLVAQ